ncbi:solute carrier organic anion transporter family member 3A1-like [Anneissia japonica]|uniref:solute carrier organic anion transporter family member 3A1-like n=1 Tax=Anneissia japonica TaxID=1529436 RepID=UPI001425B552|nr:solute carrier organic anion transporter family member 3A1-like [Anneissia japonica]
MTSGKKESESVCCGSERCPCPSRWPKHFASIGAFVSCMCAVSFADAFFLGSISSSITTLETRYNLSISKIALIGTVYNIGALAVQLFVVYFGGKRSRNRPRWIGVGLLFIALATIIMFLPQFIYGEYKYEFHTNSTGNLCRLNNTDYEECSAEEQGQNEDNERTYAFLAVGAAIAGAAWTPVKPLGFSYIDDNTNSGNSAFYIGIVNSMYGVGSILSFVVSSFFIKLWVDFYRVDTATIPLTTDDDQWAGAWWLGIIITGFIIFVSAWPFFGFPNQLLERPPKKMEEKESDTTNKCGLPRSAWRLFRNLPFMTVNLGFVTTIAIVFGITSFIPKYFETQFGLSTATANLLTGLVPVPAFGLGQLVGGYLIKKTRAGITESAKVLFITSVITLTGLLIMLGLGCSSGPIAGITASYDQHSDSLKLLSECNADCSCPEIYDPVCGDDGLTYFSPCHAGCADETNQGLKSCACVQSEEAFSSPCSITCNTLAPFVVLLFVIACTNSMEEIPQTMVTLRSVDEDDKAMAIGMREIFMRLLGMIPAPLLFGAAIDSSCIFWEETCGDSGSCLIYNLKDFRLAFFGVIVALKAISVLCNLICWRHLVGGQSTQQIEDENTLKIHLEPDKKKRVTWNKNSLALVNYGFDDAASANGDVVKLSSMLVNDVSGVPNGINQANDHTEPIPITPIWIDNVHVVTAVKQDEVKVISEFKPVSLPEPDPPVTEDVVKVVHTSAVASPAKLKWLMPVKGSTTSLNHTSDLETLDELPSTSEDAIGTQNSAANKMPHNLKWTTVDEGTLTSKSTRGRSASVPSEKTVSISDRHPIPRPRSFHRKTANTQCTGELAHLDDGKTLPSDDSSRLRTYYDASEPDSRTEPNGWAVTPTDLVTQPVKSTMPTYATVKRTKPSSWSPYRPNRSQSLPHTAIIETLPYDLQVHHDASIYATIDDMSGSRPTMRSYPSETRLPDPDVFTEIVSTKHPMGKRKPMSFTELTSISSSKRPSLVDTVHPMKDPSVISGIKTNGILKQNGFMTTNRRASAPVSPPRDECPAAIYI